MATRAYRTPTEWVTRAFLWIVSALVLLFLMAPLLAIVPLSFSSSLYLFYPIPHFSLRWYQDFFTSDAWLTAFRNSMIIGSATTVLATVLGTLAALGLAQERFPLRPIVMGFVISPLIVPVIIIAIGIYFFFAPIGLTDSYIGIVLAHTTLAVPLVVITVSATLAGFDRNMTRAAASLGANPVRAFFKVVMPIVLPGVIAGALFAFSTSLDEVVTVLFLASPEQNTIPRQMFTGIRYFLTPTITAVATMLMAISVTLLAVIVLLRRRGDRMRSLAP
jgi:putative spermidine/putrescine transport system permease protein